MLVSYFDLASDGWMDEYHGNRSSVQCLGGQGNFYGNNGNWHNFIKAAYTQGATEKGLEITGWSADVTHYFACQAISSNPELYENGDIGTMGKGYGSI